MTVVYLASPIDQADGMSLDKERLRIKEMLRLGGAATFDPSRAWEAGLTAGEAVNSIDRFAIDCADGLLAILPDGAPTIGVPTEIEYARRSGKPVAVLAGVRNGASPFLKEDAGLRVWLATQKSEEAAVRWLLDRMMLHGSHWTKAAMPESLQPPKIDVLPVQVMRASEAPDMGGLPPSRPPEPMIAYRTGPRMPSIRYEPKEPSTDWAGVGAGLRSLVSLVGDFQVAKGWDQERTLGELLALVHSEVSEALEEHRNGKGNAQVYWSHLPGCMLAGASVRTSDSVPCQCEPKPEGVPIELADAVIRIAGIAALHGWDLGEAVMQKMRYNDTRAHRHGGKVI